MTESLFQVPCVLLKVSSRRNRSAQVIFETNENLTDQQLSRIMTLIEKYGWMTFSPDTQIQPEDLLKLPPLPKKDSGKTKAERQRAILYRIWEQAGGEEGTGKTSGQYYDEYMDAYLERLKEKLV